LDDETEKDPPEKVGWKLAAVPAADLSEFREKRKVWGKNVLEVVQHTRRSNTANRTIIAEQGGEGKVC